MPNIVLPLKSENINVSLSVGDIAYYCNAVQAQGGYATTPSFENVVKMGEVKSFDLDTGLVVVDCASNVNMPTSNDYVFFSKDNESQLSSLLGYYAEVKFVNNSTEESELFEVSMEVTQSSK
tara:strand:+ start:1691 stop:2056 length:366 start_codon:yes stop_codon:yes gene_type:complete